MTGGIDMEGEFQHHARYVFPNIDSQRTNEANFQVSISRLAALGCQNCNTNAGYDGCDLFHTHM